MSHSARVGAASFEEHEAVAAFLRQQTPIRPLLAIVMGSGLGPVADLIPDPFVIPYSRIPHFVSTTGIFSSSSCFCFA